MSDGRTVKSSDLIAKKHKRRKTKEAPSGAKESSLAAAIQETTDSLKSKPHSSQHSSVKPTRITAASKPSKYNKPGTQRIQIVGKYMVMVQTFAILVVTINFFSKKKYLFKF